MKDDFGVDHLDKSQKRIARAVLSVLPKDASGGGCQAFYTPAEWAERGEEYGKDSALIICHDGGSLARFCNYSYCDYAAMDRLTSALNKIGFYVEQCTGWYSAVYPV